MATDSADLRAKDVVRNKDVVPRVYAGKPTVDRLFRRAARRPAGSSARLWRKVGAEDPFAVPAEDAKPEHRAVYASGRFVRIDQAEKEAGAQGPKGPKAAPKPAPRPTEDAPKPKPAAEKPVHSPSPFQRTAPNPLKKGPATPARAAAPPPTTPEGEIDRTPPIVRPGQGALTPTGRFRTEAGAVGTGRRRPAIGGEPPVAAPRAPDPSPGRAPVQFGGATEAEPERPKHGPGRWEATPSAAQRAQQARDKAARTQPAAKAPAARPPAPGPGPAPARPPQPLPGPTPTASAPTAASAPSPTPAPPPVRSPPVPAPAPAPAPAPKPAAPPAAAAPAPAGKAPAVGQEIPVPTAVAPPGQVLNQIGPAQVVPKRKPTVAQPETPPEPAASKPAAPVDRTPPKAPSGGGMDDLFGGAAQEGRVRIGPTRKKKE